MVTLPTLVLLTALTCPFQSQDCNVVGVMHGTFFSSYGAVACGVCEARIEHTQWLIHYLDHPPYVQKN